MTASFSALPVGQGDAFFFSSPSFAALIDGGRSRTALPALLAKRRRVRTLTAVVCTHNDADHAEGLIGLLSSDTVSVSEVWLPGQWASRLRDLFAAPVAFMHEVLVQIDGLGEEERGRSLAELGDAYTRATETGDDGPPIVEILDEAIEARTLTQDGLARHLPLWLLQWLHPFDRISTRLFWEAIDAAERIRALAYLAWERASVVRWFDVSSTPPGTATTPLIPVNSMEIVRVSAKKPDALSFLALSVSNKRSLCFAFRPAPEAPPVLLAADSDLSFQAPIPWASGMIVTAPHHGSEANAKAYGRASQEFPNTSSIVWVRSDGRFRSRPGTSFLRQPRRYCTRCRPYSGAAQEVRFVGNASSWRPWRVQPCRCV